MVSIQERIQIPIPLDTAFAYYAEFQNTAEWDPGVASSRKLTPGPLQAGDRYDVMSLFAGRKLPMTYEVISVDAPNRVTLRGVSSTGVALDDIRFEAVGEHSTRITWRLEFTLRGLAVLTEPFLKPLLNRLGKSAMRGIRESATRGLPLQAKS
jgi:hypothetical protein